VVLSTAGLVTVFVAVVVLNLYRGRRQRQTLRTWAERRGWSHRGDHAYRRSWFPLVRQFWRGAQVTGDILNGTFHGWQVTVVPARDEDVNDRVRHHVVVAVAVPCSLPTVGLRPRGRRGSSGSGALGPEVSTGHAAVDARYLVRSPDPTGARRLLTPTVCAALMRLAPTPIQTQGQWVSVYAQERPTPATLEQLLATATSAAAVLCGVAGPGN
jgi:hypothetical protein